MRDHLPCCWSIIHLVTACLSQPDLESLDLVILCLSLSPPPTHLSNFSHSLLALHWHRLLKGSECSPWCVGIFSRGFLPCQGRSRYARINTDRPLLIHGVMSVFVPMPLDCHLHGCYQLVCTSWQPHVQQQRLNGTKQGHRETKHWQWLSDLTPNKIKINKWALGCVMLHSQTWGFQLRG